MKFKIQANEKLYPDWRVTQGQLYKQVPGRYLDLEAATAWKRFVPKPERAVVLQHCHDNPTTGHIGIERTIARVKFGRN